MRIGCPLLASTSNYANVYIPPSTYTHIYIIKNTFKGDLGDLSTMWHPREKVFSMSQGRVVIRHPICGILDLGLCVLQKVEKSIAS